MKLYQLVSLDTASLFDGAFGADSGSSVSPWENADACRFQALTILLLMSILAQALFALMRGDFVTFAFFSARHDVFEL